MGIVIENTTDRIEAFTPFALPLSTHVLCLTGFSGSGKSTISTEIEVSTGYSRLDVGGYIRSYCANAGYKTVREFYQKYGISSYFSIRSDLLVVLRNSLSRRWVIDSVYDQEFVDTIRTIFGPRSVQVYAIGCNRKLRLERFRRRHELDRAIANLELKKRDGEKVSYGCLEVMKRSDFFVMNSSDSIRVRPNGG